MVKTIKVPVLNWPEGDSSHMQLDIPNPLAFQCATANIESWEEPRDEAMYWQSPFYYYPMRMRKG